MILKIKLLEYKIYSFSMTFDTSSFVNYDSDIIVCIKTEMNGKTKMRNVLLLKCLKKIFLSSNFVHVHEI